MNVRKIIRKLFGCEMQLGFMTTPRSELVALPCFGGASTNSIPAGPSRPGRYYTSQGNKGNYPLCKDIEGWGCAPATVLVWGHLCPLQQGGQHHGELQCVEKLLNSAG